MRRVVTVTLALVTAVVGAGCSLSTPKACGCAIPPDLGTAQRTASTFATLAAAGKAAQMWPLLDGAAQRHYGSEAAFASQVPSMKRLAAAKQWMVVDSDLQGSGRRNTVLLAPVFTRHGAPALAGPALPVDTPGDGTTAHNRLGVPQPATLGVRRDARHAGDPRPGFTVVVPAGVGLDVMIMSISHGRLTIVNTADSRPVSPDFVRSDGHATTGGYAYDWRPADPLPRGRYLVVFAGKSGPQQWPWNTGAITVA